MEFNEFIYRILVAFGLSFLIGIERQYRNRPVGLRTSILVCIGAFLFVSFSFNVGSTDLSRIASQVVTGIGFLGAGVILKDGKNIRGLTTAATLWCVAAVGVLCAGGAIKEAAFGTIIILFSNTLLRYINSLLQEYTETKKTHSKYEIEFIISDKDVSKIKNKILDFINSNKDYCDLVSYECNDSLNGDKMNIVLNINKNKATILENYLNEINKTYNFIEYKLTKIMDIKDIDDSDEL